MKLIFSVLLVCLLSCFLGLVPEIINTGIKISIPKYPHIEIVSFQKSVPDRVGTIKPKEYIVAQIAVLPWLNAKV